MTIKKKKKTEKMKQSLVSCMSLFITGTHIQPCVCKIFVPEERQSYSLLQFFSSLV